MAEKEMRGFEDLECYQLAMKVFREGYDVASRLPLEEKYNLADQLRRASTSIILNVAEGYGRYHYLDSLRFYYFSRGSIMEVLSALIASDDRKYTKDELTRQRELCHSALRSLNGYIRYVRAQQQGKQEYGERAIKEESAAYDVPDLPSPNLPISQSTNLP